MNLHFFVHIADQQLQHYVPAASQALRSSHPIPKPRSLGNAPGRALDAGVAYIACSVGAHSPADIVQVWGVGSAEMELCRPGHGLGMTVTVSVPAAVVGLVLETMKNAGKPEANLELAVGLEYMQDE